MSGVSTLRMWDVVDTQSFLTRIPYGIGTVGLRVCDCAMCVEKRSKTFKDTTDVEEVGCLGLFRTHEVCFHT